MHSRGSSFNFALSPAFFEAALQEVNPPTHHKTHSFRQLGSSWDPPPPNSNSLLRVRESEGDERQKLRRGETSGLSAWLTNFVGRRETGDTFSGR